MLTSKIYDLRPMLVLPHGIRPISIVTGEGSEEQQNYFLDIPRSNYFKAEIIAPISFIVGEKWSLTFTGFSGKVPLGAKYVIDATYVSREYWNQIDAIIRDAFPDLNFELVNHMASAGYSHK